jgi:RNA polymerase sigma-70 factor (ECF subfamily)
VRELFGPPRHYLNEVAVTTDEALMREFRRGSRAAFDELFARYRDSLYGFFRRRLSNTARAEELTQDTFLSVLRAAVRYEPRATVRSYLFGIAWNLMCAERRKLGRDPVGEAAAEPAGDDSPDASLWVREALAKLDASEREILMLREYEQLSYDEIAALLRLPLNTVRSRLFRARMALRGLLEPAKEAVHD